MLVVSLQTTPGYCSAVAAARAVPCLPSPVRRPRQADGIVWFLCRCTTYRARGPWCTVRLAPTTMRTVQHAPCTEYARRQARQAGQSKRLSSVQGRMFHTKNLAVRRQVIVCVPCALRSLKNILYHGIYIYRRCAYHVHVMMLLLLIAYLVVYKQHAE